MAYNDQEYNPSSSLQVKHKSHNVMQMDEQYSVHSNTDQFISEGKDARILAENDMSVKESYHYANLMNVGYEAGDCVPANDTYSGDIETHHQEVDIADKKPESSRHCNAVTPTESCNPTYGQGQEDNERLPDDGQQNSPGCQKRLIDVNDVNSHKSVDHGKTPERDKSKNAENDDKGEIRKRKKRKRPLKRCDICGDGFKDIAKLVSHLRTHENKKVPDLVGCSECMKRFSYISSLQIHLTLHMDAEQGFKMRVDLVQNPNCHSTGTRNVRDKGERHNGPENVKLKGKKKRAVCDQCGKSFSGKNSLSEHRKIHIKEKQFKCSECGEGFSSMRRLSWHKKVHRGELPVQCKICGKRFKNNNRLSVHMISHARVKPFQCSGCDKSFKYNYNLKTHMRTHTGEKPFTCDICYKGFSQNNHLLRHVAMHQKYNSDLSWENISIGQNPKTSS